MSHSLPSARVGVEWDATVALEYWLDTQGQYTWPSRVRLDTQGLPTLPPGLAFSTKLYHCEQLGELAGNVDAMDTVTQSGKQVFVYRKLFLFYFMSLCVSCCLHLSFVFSFLAGSNEACHRFPWCPQKWRKTVRHNYIRRLHVFSVCWCLSLFANASFIPCGCFSETLPMSRSRICFFPVPAWLIWFFFLTRCLSPNLLMNKCLLVFLSTCHLFVFLWHMYLCEHIKESYNISKQKQHFPLVQAISI